jgi:hypothetical protein
LLTPTFWVLAGATALVLAVGVPLAVWAQHHRTTGAERAVTERVQEFATAVAAGEGEAACSMLTDKARVEVVRRIGRALGPADRALSCEQAVRAASGERTPAQTMALRDLGITDLDYDEDVSPGYETFSTFESATASALVRGQRIELVTDNPDTDKADSWAIDSLDPILDLMAPR